MPGVLVKRVALLDGTTLGYRARCQGCGWHSARYQSPDQARAILNYHRDECHASKIT
jgi:hypothetical protein